MGQAEIQKAAPPSPASNTLDRAHLSPLSGVVCPLADGGAAWLHDGSCMSREAHVQFCERLGVRLPGATHRNIYVRSERAGQRVMESITRFITHKRPKLRRAVFPLYRPGGSSPSKCGSNPSNNKHSSRSASERILPGTRFLSSRRNSVKPFMALATSLCMS